jgi:hypothetical protein
VTNIGILLSNKQNSLDAVDFLLAYLSPNSNERTFFSSELSEKFQGCLWNPCDMSPERCPLSQPKSSENTVSLVEVIFKVF